MTPPGGRRRAAPARPSPPKARLVAQVLLAVLTGAAWVYLVRAAIDFGALARDGRALAWVFTALASLGAVGCLLLAIILVTRTLATLGLIAERPAERPPARRRAN